MYKHLTEQAFMNYVATHICKKHDVDWQQFKKNMGMPSLSFLADASDDLMDVDEMCAKYDQFIEKDTRMATGSYYTPYALAYTMVQMSFHDYFLNNHLLSADDCHTLFIKGLSALSEHKKNLVINRLSVMKVIDIACGSGVFLIATFNYVKSIYELLQAAFNAGTIVNNLWGGDVQEFPLKVLKLWLMNALIEEGTELIPSFNILHQDALLTEFNESFDLVVGNPPYIGEKGNKALFEKYKHLTGYEGRMDLFYFFIYKGMSILNSSGVLSLITTNYWITADGAVKLRKYIREQTKFLRVINLDECKLFDDAKGMHNLIFNLTKNSTEPTKVQIISHHKEKIDVLLKHRYAVEHEALFSESNNVVLYDELAYIRIIKKFLHHSDHTLKDLVKINQGIVSGADKVTDRMLGHKITQNHIKKGDGIFVIDNDALNSSYKKPFYKNSHIDAYFIKGESTQSILYITDQAELTETSVETQHLLPFKTVLDGRREVMLGKRKWYSLQWYRTPEIFEEEKIIVPQRALINKFAYSDRPFYASADVYYLTKGPLKLLLGILNSKTMYFWLYNRGKRKGQHLELYAKPLSQMPIPKMSRDEQNTLTNLVDNILKDGISQERLDKIDRLLYDIYHLTQNEIEMITALHNNIRRTNAKEN